MTNTLELARIVFDELTRSDAVGPPPARWFTMTTGAMAHCLIGASLAWYRAPRGVVIFGAMAWITKEAFYDASNAGYVWQAVADGVSDPMFALLGWWTVTV